MARICLRTSCSDIWGCSAEPRPIPQTSKLKRLPVLGGRFVYIDLLRLPTARRCAPPDTARPLEPRTPSAYSARSEGVQDAPPIGRAGGLLSQTGEKIPLLTPFSASYIPLYDFVPLENRRDMYEPTPSGYENPIGFQPFKPPENCSFSGFFVNVF